MTAKMYYKSFNPRREPVLPYHLRRTAYVTCDGTQNIQSTSFGLGIITTNPYLGPSVFSTHSSANDFRVDLMMLSGTATMERAAGQPVLMGTETHYQEVQTRLIDIVHELGDLDDDLEAEVSCRGSKPTEGELSGLFVPSEHCTHGPLIGIYLSGQETRPCTDDLENAEHLATCQPSLIRLLDTLSHAVEDMDDDQQDEIICLGSKPTEGELSGLFIPAADCASGPLLGVYLTTRDPRPCTDNLDNASHLQTCQPTFIRPMNTLSGTLTPANNPTDDTNPDNTNSDNTTPDDTNTATITLTMKHEALVQKISMDDLINTDFYVFRKSNGQLIAERLGIPEQERQQIMDYIQEVGAVDIIEDHQTSGTAPEPEEPDAKLFFHLAIRGPELVYQRPAPGSFTQWQSASGMNEALAQPQSDHLREGEPIQVIAINRATGYMGSLHTVLKAAGREPEHQENNTPPEANGHPLIDFALDELILRPPNLKIWAERHYQRASTGENDARQVIGYESAGSASDLYIAVYTQWLDAEGKPLPEGLSDVGFTARIARLQANYQDADSETYDNNPLNFFAIGPGKHLQVVQLGSNQLMNQHYYIQVNPMPESRRPDFSTPSGPVTPEKLRYRPIHFVPFQVPIYDEVASRQAQANYRALYSALQAEGTDPSTVPAYEPVYQWQYRPELQFSVYDLIVQEAHRVIDDLPEATDPSVTYIDITNEEHPILSESDSALELIYSVLGLSDPQGSEISPVDPYQGDRELVLALGAHEIQVHVTEENTLEFYDPTDIELLDAEDFLALRLYLNNDPENILWEWAFEKLIIYTPEDLDDEQQGGDVIYLSADNPSLDIEAMLVTHQPIDEAQRPRREVEWSVSGDESAQLQPRRESNTRGLFKSRVTLSNVAGTRAIVRATLQDEAHVEARFQPIEIVAGEPADILLGSEEGSAYVQGHGELNISVKVNDRHSNPVQDGTAVAFSIKGDAYVKRAEFMTQDGIATGIIKGGFFSGEDNELIVQAGNVRYQQLVRIKTLQVQWLDLPDTFTAGQRYSLRAQVTTPDGTPAKDIYLDVSTDRGLIETRALKTNEQGILPLDLYVPEQSGTITLLAKADYHNQLSQSVAVLHGENGSQFAHPFIVSDPGEQGSIRHTNLRGQSQNFNFATQTPMTFYGTPHEPWQLDLNDPYAPNHEPLTQINFDSHGLLDATGLNTVARQNVSLSLDTREAMGRSAAFVPSLDPEENSRIAIAYDPRLNAASPGFILDVKMQWPHPGTLFSHALGTMQLDWTEDQRLQLQAQTAEGPQVVQTQPLHSDTWYRIAGHFTAEELTLVVNGQPYRTTYTRTTLDYPLAPQTPESNDSPDNVQRWKNWQFLGDIEGYLDNWQWFDLDSPPVLRFGNGSLSQSGQFDRNGQATVHLRSTHQFGRWQPASTLDKINVGIRQSNGDLLPALTLMSAHSYQANAGLMSDVFGGTVNFEHFSETVSDIVHYPRFDVIANRIRDLAADTRHYQPLQMALASAGALAFRPEAKALKPYLKQLETFYLNSNNPAIIHAIADLLGEAFKQAHNRDDSLLKTLITSLTVMGEMVTSSEEAAQFLGQVIKSKYDLLVWSRFMSLPGKGWMGPWYPWVDPENVCDYTQTFDPETALHSSILPCRVPGTIMAAMVNEFAQMELAQTNPQLVTDYVKQLYDGLGQASFVMRKLLFDAEVVPTTTAANISTGFNLFPQAHATNPVAGAYRVGKVGLKSLRKILDEASKWGPANFMRFIRGQTNSRYSAVQMLGSMFFLINQMEPTEDCGNNCRILATPGHTSGDDPLHKQVHKLIGLVLSNIGFSELGVLTEADLSLTEARVACKVKGQGHGAAHELMLMAYYHMAYKLGLDKYQIMAADKQVKVPLFYKDSEGNPKKYHIFIRKPDLILHGDGDNKRIWIEAKSLSYPRGTSLYEPSIFPVDDDARSFISPRNPNRPKTIEALDFRFPFWKMKDGADIQRWYTDRNGNRKPVYGTFYLRQFYLDRIASAGTLTDEHWGTFADDSNEGLYRPNQFHWLMQVWPDNVLIPIKLKNKTTGKYETRYIVRHGSWLKVSDGQSIPDITIENRTKNFYALQERLVTLPADSAEGVNQLSVGYSNSSQPDSPNVAFRNSVVGKKDIIIPFYIKRPPIPPGMIEAIANQFNVADQINEALPPFMRFMIKFSETANNALNRFLLFEEAFWEKWDEYMRTGEEVAGQYTPEELREIYENTNEYIDDVEENIDELVGEAAEDYYSRRNSAQFNKWIKIAELYGVDVCGDE